MSLLDALLLEGYRDPRDVYIALRADGQKGSGTIDDPYDGGTRLGPELAATLTCNRREFVVGTHFAHGLGSGDIGSTVTISKARGPGKDWFNGDFELKAILSPIHFVVEFTASDLPPAPPDVESSGYAPLEVNYPDHPGTNKNALPASARIFWPVAQVTVPSGHGLTVLDGVSITNITPGDFAGDSPILGPLSATDTTFAYRLKFPGADVTTSCTVNRLLHRFDQVMRGAPFPAVLHLGPGTFETRGYASDHVSDAADFAQLYVGYLFRAGQRMIGSGIGATTLKLVLPIDGYNQTTAIGHSSPVDATGAEIRDLTVDCNAPGHVAPYGIFPAPVTCGAVGLGGSFIRIHRVRVINFCTQARAECFGISLSGGVFNVVEDCILERPGQNNTHETTLVANVGDVYGSAVSPIARHNYANCSYVKADGSIVSSEYVGVESITQDSVYPELFVLVTKRPHHRTGPDVSGKTTNNVLINSVTPATNRLNGSFPVVQKDSETQLVFKVIGGAAAGFNASAAYLGVDFHGPAAMTGTGCVTEGNALFDIFQPIYTDTGSVRDAVVRDNYYSNVGWGVFVNFPPDKFDAFRGASAIAPETITVGGDPVKCGVFTTLQPHGFSGDPDDNQLVTIREAGETAPQTGNPYHGSGLLVVAKRGTDPSHQFLYALNNQIAALPTDNCAGRPVFRPAVVTSTFAFASSGEVTVVTASDHGLASGDFVEFSGVTPSATPPNPPVGGSFSDYNGFWGPITPDPVDPKKFRFDINDTVFDPTLHPMRDSGTGGTMDRHVASGVVRNGSVATVTTVSPHGFFFGQVFKLQGAWVDGDDENPFNNVFSVKSVNGRSFSFDLKPGNDPDPTKSPTGPITYAAHWDIRNFVLENNIYDLYATDNNTAVFPRGASMFGLFEEDIPPYIFPAFVYRGNITRHIDEKVPGGTVQPSYGIFATTIGGGIVEQNIIDVSATQPYFVSGSLAHLQNKTRGGALIHGARLKPDQSTEPIGDLETRIQDALTMSLL